ncbi:MAG: hypothetical protein JWN48_5088 [Myxococcaceae bacterium]|nr:hypothetical protein [Myxococcaceae bacterium]
MKRILVIALLALSASIAGCYGGGAYLRTSGYYAGGGPYYDAPAPGYYGYARGPYVMGGPVYGPPVYRAYPMHRGGYWGGHGYHGGYHHGHRRW